MATGPVLEVAGVFDVVSDLQEVKAGPDRIAAADQLEFFKNLRRSIPMFSIFSHPKDNIMLVEVCCNGLESALNAEKAGADRVELCAELGVGGITPSLGLLQKVKESVTLPIHVLVRPRGGHFTYSNMEFEVMLRDLDHCKAMGISGVVSGVLFADGTLDVARTKQLVDLAGPMHFTFHRAFDWIGDKKRALQELEDMGVNTVLTSGGVAKAEKGLDLLMELKAQTKNITIMPGGGISMKNAYTFKETGFRAIHFSGTTFSQALLGVPPLSFTTNRHLQETHIAVTNEALVRQIVQIVK